MSNSEVLIYAPPHFLGNMGDRVVTKVAQKFFPEATFLFDNLLNYFFADQSLSKIFYNSRHNKSEVKMNKLVSKYKKFILFGMDAIDGYYDLRESISKLRLAREFAAKGRHSWVINFSWNTDQINPELQYEIYNAHESGVKFVARDSKSAQRLTYLGIKATTVNDLAFLSPEVIVPKELNVGNKNKDQRYVVLSPSRSFGNIKSQINFFVEIVPYLRSHGLHPVIFTSVTNLRIGDKGLAKKINLLLERNFEDCLPIVSTESQLLQLLTTSCCIISARMHAAIVGLSNHIPVYVLEYQGKVAGMMEDLDLPEYFTTIPNIPKYELDRLILDQSNYKKILEKQIPFFQSRAENLMKKILDTN